MVNSRPPFRSSMTASVAVVAFCLALVGPMRPAKAGGWAVVARQQGIVVEQKYVDGFDLPIIRGTGRVDAGIFEILSVLDDIDHFQDWMHGCRKAKLLETINDYDRIVYNRTATPWPVDDRDAVVLSKVTVDSDEKTVLATFESVQEPRYGEVDGVVRMPVLRGFYLLEWQGEHSTRVTYQAQADPGGFIPDFIVESESRDIPLNTIVSLRVRVRKAGEGNMPFLKKWDPRHGGRGFEGDHPRRNHHVR